MSSSDSVQREATASRCKGQICIQSLLTKLNIEGECIAHNSDIDQCRELYPYRLFPDRSAVNVKRRANYFSCETVIYFPFIHSSVKTFSETELNSTIMNIQATAWLLKV
ncbi:hypothetical protein KIN20_038374 [Parelaphostrongylus tenuis]|uniref:Uncharacterized protein n=1 Tax=Parelaphostrongylus tenuis TaxID=148309 RepID=A0AAD5MBT0_PARTN|nr:hypothetical protein KIN20_038374 [Parelaphostrongylus tenuis]